MQLFIYLCIYLDIYLCIYLFILYYIIVRFSPPYSAGIMHQCVKVTNAERGESFAVDLIPLWKSYQNCSRGKMLLDKHG